MSFNSSGVNLKGQFNLKNTDPIDGRYLVTSVAEYEALTSEDDSGPKFLYPGLTFTVTTNLTLNNGTIVKAGNYQVDINGKVVASIMIGGITLTEEKLQKLLDFLDTIELIELN